MIIKEHTNTMRDEMVIGQYHDDLNSEIPTADKHIMCCLYNTHKITMRSDTCTSAAKEYTELFLINYKFPEDWEWVKLNVHIAAYSIVHYRAVQCITGQYTHCLVSDATGRQAHMTQTRHHQHWEIN